MITWWPGRGVAAAAGYTDSYKLSADGALQGFWTTAAFWNDMSVVTLVLVMCAAFVWALLTEKLVLGRQYRKVVERADRLEEANGVLVADAIGRTASDKITNGLLTAIRNEMVAPQDEVT